MISLSSDELEILSYLKAYPDQFVALAEIDRRAGGKRKSQETPNWSRLLISRLVDEKLVEVSESGHYRIRPETAPETPKPAPLKAAPARTPGPSESIPSSTRRWASPEIAKLLASKGEKFSGTYKTIG